MGRKVIFLDIDGVLNRDETTEETPEGFTGVEDFLLDNLESLVNKTGAELVLTSDWKEEWADEYDECGTDVQYLIDKLAERGLSIIAVTDDSSEGENIYSKRGHGIKKYLRNHSDIEQYVILDDCYFEDFDEELAEHFVYIEDSVGFQSVFVKLAEYALAGEKMKQH